MPPLRSTPSPEPWRAWSPRSSSQVRADVQGLRRHGPPRAGPAAERPSGADRPADEFGGLGRAFEVGEVDCPGKADSDGLWQLGRQVVADGAEPGQVAGSGDDGRGAGDPCEVDLDVLLVDVVSCRELQAEGVRLHVAE